jgi:hypothetical protein
MTQESCKTTLKKISDMKPGDLWVQHYFGGTIIRMFVGFIENSTVEQVWDDLHELHFKEEYNWVVCVMMGGKWLNSSPIYIDALPKDAKIEILNE